MTQAPLVKANTAPILPVQTDISLHALEQRLGVICRTLKIDLEWDEHRYESFIDALKTSGLTAERRMYVLYQLFLARIATKTEVENCSYHFQDDCNAKIIAMFMSAHEFRVGHQSYTHFVVPDNDRPLMDVTYTVAYHLNTGIQRVVRSLASEIHKSGKPHELMEYDGAIQNFRLLDDTFKPLLYAWNGGHKVPRTIAERKKSPFKLRVKKVAGRRLCKLVDKTLKLYKKARTIPRLLMSRSTKRMRKIAGRGICKLVDRTNESLQRTRPVSARKDMIVLPTRAPEHALFLWDHHVLFPELIAEPHRVETARSMVEHTKINSTIVIFDMIPLTNPEYFVDSTGYIHFLTMLRCVDRVSCISRAVESNVRDMMALVHRRGTPPEIATHYLGGNFGLDLQRKENQSEVEVEEESDLPLLLAVGTIEIRKNHRRILRAMVQAQKLGYKFRGVFAGSPGWLTDSFLHELKYYQDSGYQVELAGTVSEEKLERLYQEATFTLYASLVEGFGLPIVESVVRGVPCIASNRGCMREIAEQIGGCVLVDPESEDSISNAIMTLLDEPEILEKLRLQASNATWRTWRDYADEVYEFATQPKTQVASSNDRIAA